MSDASWKQAWSPFPVEFSAGGLSTAVKLALGGFCRLLGKPLVLLFDAADCLANQTLITFLRQLRDGFVNRADAPFPSSIALVGMRDIRDYKVKIRPDGDTLGSASPFNIITKSLTLKNFTRDEIGILYAQHTAETSQLFTPEAVDRASHYQYKEAAPHLILMAFLQRVINGGGQIIREYSLGRRRLDLCVVCAGQRFPVELKLWEGPKSKEDGMLQLAAYCDSCGSTEGWLVFFDRRPKRPWSKKILWQTRHDAAGHTLHFVGC